MKAIFLDFDGVINDYLVQTMANDFNMEILKRIVDATGAVIVVSSSKKDNWLIYGKGQFEDTDCYRYYVKPLEEKGMTIYGLTSYKSNREEEIDEYLSTHPEISEFLILDDDYNIKKYKEHEVYIDLQEGLQEKHIAPSIRILNGELEFWHEYSEDEDLLERQIRYNLRYIEAKKKANKPED